MCLITRGPSATVKRLFLETKGLIEDVFKSNRDGLGIMYATTKGPKVIKSLPKSAEAARKLISKLPDDDRDVAMHWRMKTHGDIDLENCHPYAVDGGFVMHNGVLDTGNKADTTKSDTWHYARRFLEGGVMEAVAHNPRFLALITDHIGGGNKFVMLTADGRMSTAGEHRGFNLEGVWWSNDYAWSRELLDPNYDPFEGYYSSRWEMGGTSIGHWGGYKPPKPTGITRKDLIGGLEDDDEPDFDDDGEPAYYAHLQDWMEMLDGGDADSVFDILNSDADATNLRTLLRSAAVPAIDLTALDGMSPHYLEIANDVLARNVFNMVQHVRRPSRIDAVVEVLCYFTAWSIPGPGNHDEQAEQLALPAPLVEEDEQAEAYAG